MGLTLKDVRDFKGWLGNSIDAENYDQKDVEKAKAFVISFLEGADDFSFALQQMVAGVDVKTWRRQSEADKAFSLWMIVLGFMEVCSQHRLSSQNDIYTLDHVDYVANLAKTNCANRKVEEALKFNVANYVSLQMAFGYYKRQELAEVLWELGNATYDACSNRTLRYILSLQEEIQVDLISRA